MGLVKISQILSFSSQDLTFKASNLLNVNGSQKWLSSPTDRSGKIFIDFQLDNKYNISNIDIGCHNTLTVEILVNRSCDGSEFIQFLPPSILMTPAQAKQPKSIDQLKMFKKDDFCKNVCDLTWDRLRIICCQPFTKNKQFGINLLHIQTSCNVNNLECDLIEDNFNDFKSLFSQENFHNNKSIISTKFGSPDMSRSMKMIQAANNKFIYKPQSMKDKDTNISINFTPIKNRDNNIRTDCKTGDNLKLDAISKNIVKNINLNFYNSTPDINSSFDNFLKIKDKSCFKNQRISEPINLNNIKPETNNLKKNEIFYENPISEKCKQNSIIEDNCIDIKKQTLNIKDNQGINCKKKDFIQQNACTTESFKQNEYLSYRYNFPNVIKTLNTSSTFTYENTASNPISFDVYSHIIAPDLLEMMKIFLETLQFDDLQREKTTFSDVRQQFEDNIGKILSDGEKKGFRILVNDYIKSLDSKENNSSSNKYSKVKDNSLRKLYENLDEGNKQINESSNRLLENSKFINSHILTNEIDNPSFDLDHSFDHFLDDIITTSPILNENYSQPGISSDYINKAAAQIKPVNSSSNNKMKNRKRKFSQVVDKMLDNLAMNDIQINSSETKNQFQLNVEDILLQSSPLNSSYKDDQLIDGNKITNIQLLTDENLCFLHDDVNNLKSNQQLNKKQKFTKVLDDFNDFFNNL